MCVRRVGLGDEVGYQPLNVRTSCQFYINTHSFSPVGVFCCVGPEKSALGFLKHRFCSALR